MMIAIALAGAGVVSLGAASAQASMQTGGENIFSYRVGEVRVVLLSEGQNEGNPRILIDAPAEMTAPYLSEAGTYPSATNAFAVISPDGTTLVDAGLGIRLTENLAAAGIERVDRIMLTHMHGDHIGGLLKEGEPTFEGVTMSLDPVEAKYWAAQGGDAARVLELYKPRPLQVWTLDGVPAGRDGIYAITAPGHTPGHTMFLVASRGERLLIWGDLTHAMAVQMPHPEISVTYDVDPDDARVSRLETLEHVAAQGIPVAGMHIAYPGIGTIEKAAQGYSFTPVAE
ncbi:MAG: MBL fold metallo-hydrolase [Alistipes sp.]|jgi:glyoxylase-like metal-dependent hydrolase (beta-lactamase superfamily II)|nr:MBL fold metallo-hydrolase [Alistipes sp.]